MKRLVDSEIIIDSFAGGGGASTGIEMALGRSPDVAINHDDAALAMHAANHPGTIHLSSNIWKVDPDDVEPGRPIGLMWASPDCTHHSKAKGGVPTRHEHRNSRDLAWVVVRWAKQRRPRVIMLENVEEFQDWGPLVQGDDGLLHRDPDRRGETFEQWVRELKRLGYKVEWREMRACDYGAPTIRKRLFVIARRDGRPIVWPAPTHADPKSEAFKAGGLLPWRTAAEIIDWSLPCPSIFLTPAEARAWRVKRPLAEATMARIARGVKRYVLDAGEPFLVPRYGERPTQEPRCQAIDAPISTIVPTANGAQLVAAFLAQHNTDMVGHDAREPMSTIVGKGRTQGLVAAHMLNLRGSDRRDGPIDAPAPTFSANGNHAALVASFLHTITTKDRCALITVTIAGEQYVLVDIGMRMLTPRERFLAQGFPRDYRIDIEFEGKPLSGEAKGRMVGNSVSPVHPNAMIRANLPEMCA